MVLGRGLCGSVIVFGRTQRRVKSTRQTGLSVEEHRFSLLLSLIDFTSVSMRENIWIHCYSHLPFPGILLLIAWLRQVFPGSCVSTKLCLWCRVSHGVEAQKPWTGSEDSQDPSLTSMAIARMAWPAPGSQGCFVVTHILSYHTVCGPCLSSNHISLSSFRLLTLERKLTWEGEGPWLLRRREKGDHRYWWCWTQCLRNILSIFSWWCINMRCSFRYSNCHVQYSNADLYKIYCLHRKLLK